MRQGARYPIVRVLKKDGKMFGMISTYKLDGIEAFETAVAIVENMQRSEEPFSKTTFVKVRDEMIASRPCEREARLGYDGRAS